MSSSASGRFSSAPMRSPSAPNTASGSRSISTSRSSTSSVCPHTSRWWYGFCSTPFRPIQLRAADGPAGRCLSARPIPRDRVIAPRAGGAARRTSAPVRPRRCGGRRAGASASVAGSTSKPNSQAKRARRSTLSGSSSKECSVTARRRPCATSASPPCGSTRVPLASSGRAMALTVKSRSARSASMPSPRSGVRSNCHERSRAIVRHAPNRSESGNRCASAAVAKARAARSGIACDDDVKVLYRAGRSRNASRTGPPTSHARSPDSAERAS